MSGHSKWAQIKHKKAGTDQKRGQVFSKMSRMIGVVAREGGPDPDRNSRLRQVIDQARAAGLPKENIERAIERARPGAGGESATSVEYEAYGPGGSAWLISGITDNANRTTNEIKHLLSEYGGSLAASGSVGWLFERKILVEVPAGDRAEERELLLIDAGADDTSVDAGVIRAAVLPERQAQFQNTLRGKGVPVSETASVLLPKTTVKLSESDRARAEKLRELLEDHADVNDVWTNIEGE